MIFTLYYMYSTVVQWWRLGTLRNKLAGTLNSHNALMVCTGNTISDSNNRRCLENLLFHNEDRIGCTVVPKQHVDLSQWIAFPRDYNYFPIFISDSKALLKSPRIYLFIQAQLNDYSRHQGEIVQVENYGELVAWRAPEHFELVLKTDMYNLTKIVNCFSDHNIDINHELKVLRIETIEIEGNPTKIKYDLRFPLEQRVKYSFAPVHWRNFVREVKILYSKLPDASPHNKVLDHPTITIETSSKVEEARKVPVSEVKPIKKSLESTKHHHKTQRKESKNKLDVTAAVDTRRQKSGERKSKSEKSTDPPKKKDHKSSDGHKSEGGKTRAEEEGETSRERVKPPKLGECCLSEQKAKRTKKHHSHDRHESHRKTVVNGHEHATDEMRTELTVKVNDDVKIETTCVSSGVQNKEKEGTNVNSNINSKPPNVLVYADSVVARDNVKNVLHAILNNHKYTVYDFPVNTNSQLWNDSTALIVVCGNVPVNLTSQLLQYLVTGGQLLCLCSDLLYSVLHIFSTAEVREHELVRFSYGNWKRVKMMHHVFCYQASPAKRQFSKDSDQSNHSSRGSSPVAPRTPSVVEIQHGGKKYTIQVQVLGAEETWHTPSLLLASVKNSKGTAIFSQVHLEIDPTQYQDDESKYRALKESNQARLEILKHILSQHLAMDCTVIINTEYGPGYFLGMHDLKQAMLSECRDMVDNTLINEKITLKFCGKGIEPEPATAIFLPVLIHACPSNFSTVKYFETLEAKDIGRLVIYVDILTSTQFMLAKTLRHGLAVIVKQQTQGVGRSGNSWLSPLGCAMFSIQLHIPMNSTLGKSLPLVQHLVMIAVVSSIRSVPGYEEIDLGLKWPNDLYANHNIKIGGLIVNSSIYSDTAIVNIGCGVNLDNSEPTTCINDVIRSYSDVTQNPLATIPYEAFFANVFNEIEGIYNIVQEGNLNYLFELYYKYWLHSGAEVTVTANDGRTCQATIIGIDEYGFLTVRSQDGAISNVQPDGNSFDMLKGLVAPKIF
ncbi:hypothetical protein ILUMI_01705 [Ignelater luminosus]|uniref:BPL/LPL catalytic domain-containing protein n=1 Tax=Ignelater luminosus TaxID=2038154 RepID=A0A8K0DQ66_IGNLU|nr:hypothetical protein ILUMI_01705 [Ignelater luminosus]